MTGCLNFPAPASARHDLSSDSTWEQLYLLLRPYVRRLVYSSDTSSWSGQEADIVEDIVQETITRTLKYARQAELGQTASIASLEGLSKVIARNYCQDLRRHDVRLVRTEQNDSSPELYAGSDDAVDLLEVALNNMFLEKIFVKLSSEVVKFPHKQRAALLVDLANRMYFGVHPTPLQQAFQGVGIRLQDYRQSLPDDPTSRGRHSSLVSLGYKRVNACMQQYYSVQ